MGNYEIKLNPFVVYGEMNYAGVPFNTRPDDNIKAPVWNQFADVVGGKHIKSNIEFDNAITSIKGYLNGASLDKQDKVADHFGFHKVTQEEAKEYDEKAIAFLNELAENASLIKFNKKEYTTPLSSGYKLEARLPDGRSAKFLLDKSGKLIDMVWVNFDTSNNGVNFENKPIDYNDVCYFVDKKGTFSYITNEGVNGNRPHTSSDAYEVSGSNTPKIKELSEKIISTYQE